MINIRESFIIAGRELGSLFSGPVAYIVITVFLFFTGFFFFSDFFYYNQAEMRSLFQMLPILFCFFIPAVTMRLFAEERHSGSIEIITTMPVSPADITAGKFMAALAFTAVMISPTLIYFFTVTLVGAPDPGPVIGGYAGALFLAGAYVSIGLLASSLTRNQVSAFIAAWAATFTLWLIDKITLFFPPSMSYLAKLGTDYHFQNIARGVIDIRDIIYFVTITGISLLLTARAAERG